MKDFKCKNCFRVVGQTDGLDLYFDGKPVPSKPIKINFTCFFCDKIILWESIERKYGRK